MIDQKIDAKLGLSGAEASLRLKQYGENTVRGRRAGPIILFVRKFTSPLVLTFIACAIVSYFVGETNNSIILVAMVLISVVLDFVNSYKSEQAVGELLKKIAITATIYRDGKQQEIELKYIVPGDVIFLSAGDVIPADCELLEAKDFYVNQAALTGESFPVQKTAQLARKNKKDKEASDGTVYLGTSVVTGYATAQVLNTGFKTEYGKIAAEIEQGAEETNFEKQIRAFTFFIVRITIFMAAFAFLVNALIGHGWFSSFLFALAIAIGLAPEFLPVIISVSLSRGALIMAKKNVIVRHLNAIQNFGGMNVLCTDKTGTLTEGRIVLVKHIDSLGETSEETFLYSYLNSFFHTGVENPLDNAIKEHKKADISSYKKIDEVPFDFQRKRQSIVVSHNRRNILITKGAPEEIFRACSFYKNKKQIIKINQKNKLKIVAQFEKLSKDGFKVLALATREENNKKKDYSVADERGMILLGFVTFLDPPKETAAKAIQDLENLGIEIKILTGDNILLTQKACRDINLPVKGVITGEELDKIDDLKLQKLLPQLTIFSRVNPEQKERIILNLKKIKKVVGFLGDGINDAPSLRVADVGISVNNAVDVAKETADIILLQKSLRVLSDGVIEGRRTYHNTLKYILMGLSSDFGNMSSMMAASAFLPFLPMLPTQILFNDLLYHSSQLTLPTDNVDSEDIRKPVKWDLGFIKHFMMVFGWISSIFDFFTYGVLFLVFRVTEGQFQAGWFIESIATQVFVIYIIRTKKIPFLQSRPSLLLFLTTFLAVVCAWIVPATPLGRVLGFAPLPGVIYLIIAGSVIAYLILVQAAKSWFYQRFREA